METEKIREFMELVGRLKVCFKNKQNKIAPKKLNNK